MIARLVGQLDGDAPVPVDFRACDCAPDRLHEAVDWLVRIRALALDEADAGDTVAVWVNPSSASSSNSIPAPAGPEGSRRIRDARPLSNSATLSAVHQSSFRLPALSAAPPSLAPRKPQRLLSFRNPRPATLPPPTDNQTSGIFPIKDPSLCCPWPADREATAVVSSRSHCSAGTLQGIDASALQLGQPRADAAPNTRFAQLAQSSSEFEAESPTWPRTLNRV